jgi:hypothetical protein
MKGPLEPYMQEDEPLNSHVPLVPLSPTTMQRSPVSHGPVPGVLWQEPLSGIVAVHVPDVPPSPAVAEQLAPSLQMISWPVELPHAPPGAASASVSHIFDVLLQMRPSVTLHAGAVFCVTSHAPPIVVTDSWQVPSTGFLSLGLEPTQESPTKQGSSGPHIAPLAPGATHLLFVEHTRPCPQSSSLPHASPTAGVVSHVPQAAFGSIAQKPVAHCEAKAQPPPDATVPFTGAQADGGFTLLRKSVQVQLEADSALAHAERSAGVAPVEDALSSFVQSCVWASTHVSIIP